MSETSDMMMNGELCQGCGVYIGEDVGYPLSCASCAKGEVKPAKAKAKPIKPKVKCQVCGKKVSELGLRQHIEAVHKEPKKESR